MKMTMKTKNGLSVLVVTTVVLLLAAMLFVGAGAATDGNVATLSNSTWSQGYPTINAAVQAWNGITNPGEYTIAINDGEYTENCIVIEQNPNYPGRTLTIKPLHNHGVTMKTTQNDPYPMVFFISGDSDYRGGRVNIDDINFNLGVYNKSAFAVYFASGGSGTPDPYLPDYTGRYAHDVTISNCSFTGVAADEKTMALQDESNSAPSNIVVKDCTLSNIGYLASGYFSSNKGNGITVTNVTMTGQNKAFINNQGEGNISIDNCTVTAQHDYIIRTRYAASSVEITNSQFTSTYSDTDQGGIITIRKSGDDNNNLKVSNCEFVKADCANMYDILSVNTIISLTGDVTKTIPANGYFNFINVAKIGDTEYATLQAAIDAAADNDVIVLLRDINLGQAVNVGKKINLTIDGRYYTINQADSLAASSPYHVFNFGTQAGAADGNYTVKNLNIDGFTSGTYFIRCENCNVSFENCTVSNNILDTANSQILIDTNAAVSLKNCTFDSNKADGHIINLNANTASRASVPDVRIENCLFNNNTAGETLVFMSDVYGDTRIMDSSFTGNHVGNNNAEAAIVYLSGKVNVTGSLFKDNEIASTTSSAKVGVIATGGTPDPDGAVITGNAFDANTITADNVVSGTIYLKAHMVNLSENYWKDGTAPSMGDKMDIYLHPDQEGMILDSYANAYQIHPNGRGVTVSVYTGVTITFNGNGADSGSMAVQSAKKGSDVILSPNNYTKADQDFIGWNASSASGTAVDYVNLGVVSSISQSMTLYAVWKDQIKPGVPENTEIKKSTSSETATNITVADSSNLSVDTTGSQPVAVLISDTANVTMTYLNDGLFSNSSTAVNGTIVSIVVEPKLGDTVLGPTQDTAEKNDMICLNLTMNASEPAAMMTSIPQLIVAVNATKVVQLATQLNASGTKYVSVGAMLEGTPQNGLTSVQMNNNISSVDMTLYVNASWVQSHGKNNITVYHIADDGTLTPMSSDFTGQETVKGQLFEKIHILSSLGFSGYSITAVWDIPTPGPVTPSPGSSSRQTGYTQILLEGEEIPTVTPTPTPAPAIPTANPVTQPTQKSPAPLAGIIAGLGAVSLILARMRH